MKRVFKVSGMKCMGCVASVKDALASLPGVDAVVVDLETGIARFEGEIASEAVRAALAAAGYPGEEIEG